MHSVISSAKEALKVLVPSVLAVFVLAIGFSLFFADAYFTLVEQFELKPPIGRSFFWGFSTFTVWVFLGFFTGGRFYKTLFIALVSAWAVYGFVEYDGGRHTIHHLLGYYISGAPIIVPSLVCGHVGFFVGTCIRIRTGQSKRSLTFLRSLAVLLVAYSLVVGVFPNAYFYWWEREARSKFQTALTMVGSTETQGDVWLETTDVYGESEETTRIARHVAENRDAIERLKFEDYGHRWHTYEVAILLGESEEYRASVSYYSNYKMWSVFCCEEPEFGTSFPDVFPAEEDQE